MNRNRKIIFLILAGSIFLMGAAPTKSEYSSVPRKKATYGSNEEISSLREESVRPEEVYKHGVQEFALIANETGYHPSKIYVRRNIPVHLTLTSASSRRYCFVMDEFNIRQGFGNQEVETVRFLPTKPGQYKFYCPVDQLTGSIIVRD